MWEVCRKSQLNHQQNLPDCSDSLARLLFFNLNFSCCLLEASICILGGATLVLTCKLRAQDRGEVTHILYTQEKMLSDCCTVTHLKGNANTVDKFKAYLLFSDGARPLINPLFVSYGSNSQRGYYKNTLCSYRSCRTLIKKGAEAEGCHTTPLFPQLSP